MKAVVKTRFAPTPSGYLHLGNALSFAITWALARQRQGAVVLRIDDLDNARFRPEYLQDIFDTLHFLGLDYEEGPRSPEDFLTHYSQMHRLPRYRQVLEQLVAQGLVYACPCSRKQIAARSPEGTYPLTCRHLQLPLTEPQAAWRVQVPEDNVENFHDLLLGGSSVPLGLVLPDFVVRRKDGIPAYQITSLADDLDMGITLLVRGQDLLTSTAAQVFLARQLGAQSFLEASFLHHPLLQDRAGNKLSKSHGSLSLTQLRGQGMRRQEVWSLLGEKLGWVPGEVTDAASFAVRFRLEELQAKADA